MKKHLVIFICIVLNFAFVSCSSAAKPEAFIGRVSVEIVLMSDPSSSKDPIYFLSITREDAKAGVPFRISRIPIYKESEMRIGDHKLDSGDVIEFTTDPNQLVEAPLSLKSLGRIKLLQKSKLAPNSKRDGEE